MGVKIGRITSNYNTSSSNDLFNFHIFNHKHKVEKASGGKVKLLTCYAYSKELFPESRLYELQPPLLCNFTETKWSNIINLRETYYPNH